MCVCAFVHVAFFSLPMQSCCIVLQAEDGLTWFMLEKQPVSSFQSGHDADDRSHIFESLCLVLICVRVGQRVDRQLTAALRVWARFLVTRVYLQDVGILSLAHPSTAFLKLVSRVRTTPLLKASPWRAVATTLSCLAATGGMARFLSCPARGRSRS